MSAVTRVLMTTALLLLAAAAVAQEQGPELKKLELFNDDLKRGFSALEGGWGADPAAEGKRIEKANGIAKQIGAALTADLESAGEPYQRVRQNLTALQGEIANARLAHTYSLAEARVRAAHKAGKPASEEDLKALQDAVKQLKERTGAGWQATVAHFETRTTRIEKDRRTLAGASVAAPAAATEAAPPAAGLADAMKEANRQRRTLVRYLEDNETPIPEEMLTKFREAAARVSALSERAGRYYTTVYRAFLVANAWRQPDEEAFTTLPNLYQGELLGQGTSKRRVKVSLNAPDGWCFAVAMSLRSFSGSEGLKDVEWKHQDRSATVQRFDLPHTGPGWQQLQGACPSQPGKLTFIAKVEGDRKTEVRWLAVGWPKETFPLFVSEYMRLLPPDRCDDESWYRSWTHPIPGALVYVGQEPHLLLDAERPPRDEVVVLSVVGERKKVKKSALTSKAPDKRAFATKFAWTGCPVVEDATGEAKKLQRCLERVEKKYAKNIQREEGRLERAATDSTRERIDKRIEALRAKEDADREAKCDPIGERIREQAKRTYDRIVDLHLDNPVITPKDRADQLKAEQEADPELR